MMEEMFREMYAAGETPWELHRPDGNLIEIVRDYAIAPGPALDIGCGTGNNTIWLAQHGFTATGCDVAEIAVDQAIAKAAAAQVACTFLRLDFLSDAVPGGPFAFLFDRGCFHSFDSAEERRRFAGKSASLLRRESLWLSLVGNCDEIRDTPGPPQCSALDIISAVEPFFEIHLLESNHFDTNRASAHRNWVCLMKKRMR
ncbi:MAG: class I SAM-dependent methyltransferase [Proteobacteria bacterium]|nr:class I SAM-dependent methyltransferase [Pseudomonadota bacterium]MBU0968088.1 class I SAM-dependent methyltransferase [Pseudomonadota bacterium]